MGIEFFIVGCACIFLGIVLAALIAFRKEQRIFPWWFRAYIFIPVLSVLYVAIGWNFPFSPEALTKVLPGFMLGLNDWGVGNMYTYAKIVDWIGIIAGTLAVSGLRDKENLLRSLTPHIVAVIVLHLNPFALDNCIPVDLYLLLLWFFVGMSLCLALMNRADSCGEKGGWSFRILLWCIVIGWFFVPVAVSRP